MSHSKNDEKRSPAFNTDEPGWIDIELEPHRAKATVNDQVHGWTDIDIEARAPPKKRLLRYGTKTKTVVGLALVAMLLTGIFVPMVIAIRNRGSKGIQ